MSEETFDTRAIEGLEETKRAALEHIVALGTPEKEK